LLRTLPNDPFAVPFSAEGTPAALASVGVSCAMDEGLVEFLPMSCPVALLAENDALRDFGKASFLGP